MDWLVLHSSGGGIAHALLAVRFVVAVIALKPLHIGLTSLGLRLVMFERQPIEKVFERHLRKNS